MSNPYVATADTLTARIVALIPTQPQILEMTSAWDLFKVPGFSCSDLGPSLAQASYALGDAQRIWKERAK